MSILLDAVNRQKQQQTDVVDITSIPSHQYSSPTQGSRKLNKFSLLAVAIAIGIGAAWGMSVLLQSPSKQLGTVEPITAVDTLATVIAVPTNSLVTPTAQPAVAKTVEPEAQNNDEIRLAGKVALPIAKPFNHFSVATSVGSNVNANTQTYIASAEADRAYSQPNQLSQSNQSNYQQQNDQNEQERVDQAAALNRQEEQAQQQIILGANANRRGLAELEALRLQVNAAAKDVDFSSVKQPSIDERNNLLAAFQTALKDVEYEQSVNQQVTEPKLDTIPTPSNKQIPKYGDLPASVQLQVPEFNINAHVYSTEPSNRWLNVDGVELQQGDMIQNKLTIVEIRPRDIVLEIDGEQFRVPAI